MSNQEVIQEDHTQTPQDQTPQAQEVSSDPVGNIVEGTVTHVTTFGAFVKLDNGEEGLVHISEVANEYVTDITAFVTIGVKVQVKVLGRNAKGKLDLSMKKVQEAEPSALFLRKKTRNDDFETKISSFLKRSEEKQIDIRRNLKNKQGIVKRKK